MRSIIRKKTADNRFIVAHGKMAISLSSKYKNFLVYWLPIIVYCLFIFIQSSFPSPEELPRVIHFDKLLHFMAFACLGALFFRAFRTLRIKNNLNLILTLSILLSSLYGITDEIHQHFVPYRNAEVLDALLDMLGSVFGVFVYQFLVAKNTN